MGSADLMPRNLDSRVELVAPVEDPELKAEMLDVLERCFADNANAWELDADGRWTRNVAPASERAQRPGGAARALRRPRRRAARRGDRLTPAPAAPRRH